MIHKKFTQLVSPSAWASVPLWCLLLHEGSTAAPVVGDEFVSDLVPAVNELENDDYARVECTGLAATWNDTLDVWELTADTTTFPAMDPAHAGQGVLSAVFFALVGDDTTSPILRSVTLATAVELDSTSLVVPWTAPIRVGPS